MSGLVSRSIVKLIKDKPADGWIRASNIKLKDTDEQFSQIILEMNQLKDVFRSNTYNKSYDNIPKIRSEERPNDNDKVELGVVGVSFSRTKSNTYIVLFDNNINKKRIAVTIGSFEAQSIVITLEGLIPPRPLTHDLFKNFLDSIGLKVVEIIIDKYVDGVYYAIIRFSDGLSTFEIDSRLSDSIAIALRCKVPIYTYNKIIDQVGHDLEKDKSTKKTTITRQ